MFYGQVYADFLQHCRPAGPPQPWGRFSKNAGCWERPKDVEKTLAALLEKHGAKDLLRSGVASQDKKKKLVLNPVFDQLYCSILPLRAFPECNPFNLLTDEGIVSGRLPIYAVFDDHLVAKGIDKRGFLFVTFSLQDLMSLRAVGMPATLASGLDRMSRETVELFRQIFGLAGGSDHASHAGHMPAASPPFATTPAQEEEADGTQPQECGKSLAGIPEPSGESMDPLQLIFVGWNPAELSPDRPANLDRVLCTVKKIGRVLGDGLDEVLVWRPTMAEIQDIGLCLSKGSRTEVTKAILSSLDQSAKPLIPSQSDEEPSGGLLEARARLRDASLRRGPAHWRRRLREWQQAVDRTLVLPLYEQAAKEPDAEERSRLSCLATANNVLHTMAELYLGKLEKEMVRTGLRGDGAALGFKEVVKMFDVVYKLTKDSK